LESLSIQTKNTEVNILYSIFGLNGLEPIVTFLAYDIIIIFLADSSNKKILIIYHIYALATVSRVYLNAWILVIFILVCVLFIIFAVHTARWWYSHIFCTTYIAMMLLWFSHLSISPLLFLKVLIYIYYSVQFGLSMYFSTQIFNFFVKRSQ
jgi:hypothetical protein